MNKNGHPETLVQSHPANSNAAKAGVYSRRLLDARVTELEGAIESTPPAEVRRDVARRDLAGVMALTEALDAALLDGVVSSRGQAKDLVRMRLKASTVLRTAVHEYEVAAAAAEELANSAESSEVHQELDVSAGGDLLTELAQAFGVDSIAELGPLTFDAATFVQAISATTDPGVRRPDRNRADRLLLKFRAERAHDCICERPRRAGSPEEFTSWLAEFRSRYQPHRLDPTLAAIVRLLGAGRRLGPPHWFEWQIQAFKQVVDYEVHRARGEKVHEGGAAEEAEDERIRALLTSDPAVQRFWRTVLSPDALPARDRLEALAKLNRVDALRKCVCPQEDRRLQEVRTDLLFAATIRALVRTSLLGAQARALFPESLAALREIIDPMILAEREVEIVDDASTDLPQPEWPGELSQVFRAYPETEDSWTG